MAGKKLLWNVQAYFTSLSDTSSAGIEGKISSIETTGKTITYGEKCVVTIATGASLNLYPVTPAAITDVQILGFVTYGNGVALASQTVTVNMDLIGAAPYKDFIAGYPTSSFTVANNTGADIEVEYVAYFRTT